MKLVMKTIPLLLVCASNLFSATTSVTLKQGWNAIGPNSETTLTELQTQLGTNLLNIQSPDGTKTYNSTSTRDPSFSQFEIGVGYWLKVSSDANLSVTENSFTTNQTISLNTGWNLIDPLNDMTLVNVQKQLGTKLLNIQSPDGTKTYNSTSTRTPSFENFTSTLGFWVKLSDSSSLIFSFENISDYAFDSDLSTIDESTDLSGKSLLLLSTESSSIIKNLVTFDTNSTYKSVTLSDFNLSKLTGTDSEITAAVTVPTSGTCGYNWNVASTNVVNMTETDGGTTVQATYNPTDGNLTINSTYHKVVWYSTTPIDLSAITCTTTSGVLFPPQIPIP